MPDRRLALALFLDGVSGFELLLCRPEQVGHQARLGRAEILTSDPSHGRRTELMGRALGRATDPHDDHAQHQQTGKAGWFPIHGMQLSVFSTLHGDLLADAGVREKAKFSAWIARNGPDHSGPPVVW
jgi:hypothetical protein